VGDDSWFHCEIRRIIDGQPAKYSDNENCFGFEDLAVLESNTNYEHMDYYAGGSNGLTMSFNQHSKFVLSGIEYFSQQTAGLT
jgi:hypothetical protein